MKKFVFPWHKEIVDLIHKAGKYAILHSCGYQEEILEDIIDLGYDAKHSYEDNIIPVEKAYEQMKGRIAVLGGIDLDYVCRESVENIQKRSKAMLLQGETGYALGSGNSIPSYVPIPNYIALIESALK